MFSITEKNGFEHLDFLETPLVELHLHVGGAVAPHVLWHISHLQGLRLPVKNYWGFRDMITIQPDRVQSLDEYLAVYEWTERIQSSPLAIERCIYEVVSKEYRASNVQRIELRFNPMKRNLGGERDLDHIIQAAIRALDHVTLEYDCQAGLIFCLAREFPTELNRVILEKAIRYRSRGVLAIDLAGPYEEPMEQDEERLPKYRDMYALARSAGLRTTIHVGETTDTGPDEIITAVEELRPDRIGHGIQAYRSEEAMAALRESNTPLEVCPSSNLRTRAAKDIDHLRTIIRTLLDNDVEVTINTDGTYILDTSILGEIRLLYDNEIMTKEEIESAIQTAHKRAFLPGDGEE